jgi:hypothetical protein
VVSVFVVLVFVLFVVVVVVVVVVKDSALGEGCWDVRIGREGIWLANGSQARHGTNRGIDRSHPLMRAERNSPTWRDAAIGTADTARGVQWPGRRRRVGWSRSRNGGGSGQACIKDWTLLPVVWLLLVVWRLDWSSYRRGVVNVVSLMKRSPGRGIHGCC